MNIKGFVFGAACGAVAGYYVAVSSGLRPVTAAIIALAAGALECLVAIGTRSPAAK
jgi:hypothetical protein